MLVTFTGGEPLLRRDLEDARRRGRPRDPPQVRHADHARRHAHRRSARTRSGTPGSTSSTSRSTTSTSATTPRAASPDSPRSILDRRSAHARRAGSTTSASTRSSRTTTSISSCRSCTRAAELGAGVNFSVYTDAKNGNATHLLGRGRATPQLDAAIARTARVQAAAARRDRELRPLPASRSRAVSAAS